MTEVQSDFEDWLSVNTPCFSEYNRQQIEWLMWQAWQASRAAIVVKLPDWDCYDTPRQALEACEDRLNEAGISYV